MKYLVYAFYPNLGMPIRITSYENRKEMLEYVSALRITDTPYVVQNVRDKNHPFIIYVDCADIGKEKMIEMLNEYYGEKDDKNRF